MHESPDARLRMMRLLSLVTWLGAGAAFAGEPLRTDDASILEPGFCQAEAWHQWSTRNGHVGWLLPACGVASWLEVGAGFARYRDADVGGHTLFQLQAKSVFHTDPGGRFAIGAVAAAVRDGGRDGSGRIGFHDASALGLVSFNALDETLRMHVNAGVVYSQAAFTTAAWGTAVEYDFRDDWTLLAEVFRDGPGRPAFQLGVRYMLVTDRVELFASYSDRLRGNGDGWFATFGVRFQTPKLF